MSYTIEHVASETSADPPWPLPMTPFEAFAAADDSSDYPMTFFGELRFQGELRREEFVRAVAAATRRHPLLRAKAVRQGSHCEWQPLDEDSLPAIDFTTGVDVAPPLDHGFLDIATGHGVRFWVRTSAGESYLLVQFHHACCDGHGAMGYLEDVLTLYATYTAPAGDAPSLRELDPSRLDGRGVFRRPAIPTDVVRKWWHPIRDAWRFHTQRPTALARVKGDLPQAAKRSSFPGTISRFFNDDESRRIRDRVTNRTGTTNDVAAAAILSTLRDWNREHGCSSGRYRLLIPIDLRTRGDELLPAANRVTFSFLTRLDRELASPEALIGSIRDETLYVKRTGAGLDFLDALDFLHQRGWLPWIISRRRCLASAVLTNMGDPTRRFQHRFPRVEGMCVVGDVVLRSITGSPPLRPQTHVGFGIGVYAGRIVVNTRCDPHGFTHADTQRLAEMFAERLLG